MTENKRNVILRDIEKHNNRTHTTSEKKPFFNLNSCQNLSSMLMLLKYLNDELQSHLRGFLQEAFIISLRISFPLR